MKVIASTGREDIARVYIGDFSSKRQVEFVESIQPPIPREEKWVLIISTLFGCPVGCRICDAGQNYQGPLSREELLAQIDFLIRQRYPNGKVPVKKFKIQFARMGEPALNPAVLEVLRELPNRYHAPGLMPSLSTVAPRGSEDFFSKLIGIKQELYPGGRFQLQFSLHSTDETHRDRLVPIRKWSLGEIADFGTRFREDGDRKITLNFALARDVPLEAKVLLSHFSPEDFLIKVTPLNPTYRAQEAGLESYLQLIDPKKRYAVLDSLREAGYQVLVSIGEPEENQIGSNCGQYLERHLREEQKLDSGYSYLLREHQV